MLSRFWPDTRCPYAPAQVDDESRKFSIPVGEGRKGGRGASYDSGYIHMQKHSRPHPRCCLLPPFSRNVTILKTRDATEPTQIEEAKGTSALPAPEPAAAAAAASATPKFEAVPIGKWEPVAAPTPAPPDAPREGGKGGGRVTAAVAAELGSSTTGVFGVGARVEVLSADKWYPAVSVY